MTRVEAEKAHGILQDDMVSCTVKKWEAANDCGGYVVVDETGKIYYRLHEVTDPDDDWEEAYDEFSDAAPGL